MLCQRCGKKNSHESETCGQCGYKLYALVTAAAPEPLDILSYSVTDEVLLSKMTHVERRLQQYTEEVGLLIHALDYLERSALANRAGINVLVRLLRENGILETREFSRRWLDQTVRSLMDLEKKERFLDCKDDIQAAFQGKSPKRFEGRLSRAEDLLYIQDSHTAISVLEEALEMDPGNAHLAAFIGESYLGAGDLEKARGFLDQAMKSTSPPGMALQAYVRLLLQEGDHGQAISVLKDGLKIHVSDPELLSYVALAHGLRGNWKECRKYAEKAVGHLDGPAPLYLLAHALIREAKTAEAEVQLDLLTSMFPECEEAILQQALLCLAKGWWKRGAEHLQRLSRVNPDRDTRRILQRFREADPKTRREGRILPLSLSSILNMMIPARGEAQMLLHQGDGEY